MAGPKVDAAEAQVTILIMGNRQDELAFAKSKV